jgi:hypothetical protein
VLHIRPGDYISSCDDNAGDQCEVPATESTTVPVCWESGFVPGHSRSSVYVHGLDICRTQDIMCLVVCLSVCLYFARNLTKPIQRSAHAYVYEAVAARGLYVRELRVDSGNCC